MNPKRKTTLIVTVGGQPQVVTFALDDLLQRGFEINQLLIIHFSSETSRLQEALRKIKEEIESDRYQMRAIQLSFVPIESESVLLNDVRDEVDAHITWEKINQLIIDLKKTQQILHVCVSGGRRILGMMTMSAAMLHFGHQDKLWHMYTPDYWIEKCRDGKLMHLPPDTGFTMIQVPMMPWGSYFPILRELTRPITQEDDVLATSRQFLDYGEETRRNAVLNQLSSRQKEVLSAFAEGYNPQQVAEKLFISIKTVDSHKTIILAECRNAWALPEETWLDYRFIWDKFEKLDQ